MEYLDMKLYPGALIVDADVVGKPLEDIEFEDVARIYDISVRTALLLNFLIVVDGELGLAKFLKCREAGVYNKIYTVNVGGYSGYNLPLRVYFSRPQTRNLL